ncbi:uncharacterized protein LOC130140956 [Syzygium oleosum]|uniref:uncharacterized protein LOC130140956 n=1 Tax=Syzygium oleosum TaxID=219896 RepID=UPI0024B98C3D|nr:uncharacterized protein LOC130140956 [Syzygium oleosum]
MVKKSSVRLAAIFDFEPHWSTSKAKKTLDALEPIREHVLEISRGGGLVGVIAADAHVHLDSAPRPDCALCFVRCILLVARWEILLSSQIASMTTSATFKKSKIGSSGSEVHLVPRLAFS